MGIFKRDKTVQGSSQGPEVPVTRNIVRVTFSKGTHTGQHDFVMDKNNTNQMTVISETCREYGNNVQIHDSRIIGETNA